MLVTEMPYAWDVHETHWWLQDGAVQISAFFSAINCGTFMNTLLLTYHVATDPIVDLGKAGSRLYSFAFTYWFGGEWFDSLLY
jgi:hypothetical protein